jgi:flagellar motor protein MotB
MKKKVFILSALGFCFYLSNAQEKLGDRIIRNTKEKSEYKAEQKSDETLDNIFNKTEELIDEGINNLFKKKNKKKKEEYQLSEDNQEQYNENFENKKSKTSQTAVIEENQEQSIENVENKKSNISQTPVKGSSKFDFVAGEKVLYFDNFDRLDVGDFPAEFNSNASGEIVIIEGKPGKWLSMNKNGAFVPDNIKKLPENFTLEFEVGIYGDPTNNQTGLGLNFTTQSEDLMKDAIFSNGTSILFLHPGAEEASILVIPTNGSVIENRVKMPQWFVGTNQNFAKVSLWRQKGRLRVYVNEDKILDVPRFFTESTNYDFAFFRSFFGDCEIYLTNIRFAIAGGDTRNKLITEGRFVTNGILFDVNSDNIKPESETVLKEIATILQENPTVRVKIVGHTDSDGDDAFNLDLSQKRAAAVKKALSTLFGIDANRMETDGKGESQPLNNNATPAEKAQNRRVEFIKL